MTDGGDPEGLTAEPSDAIEGLPAKAGDARGGPLAEAGDARAAAMRVDVRAAMGIDAGPWTVDPSGLPGNAVRWLSESRAVVGVEAVDGSVREDPTTLGEVESSAVSGVRRREVVVGGWRLLLDVESERRARLRERARRGLGDAAHSGPLEVRAIIPGRVVAVSVSEGDAVEQGHQLMVIEAMKMQNELRSPRAGIVERLAVGPGQTVELGTLLLVIR